MEIVDVAALSLYLLLIGSGLRIFTLRRGAAWKLHVVSKGFLFGGGALLLGTAIFWTWPLALGVGGVAAVIWFILYFFGREAPPPR